MHRNNGVSLQCVLCKRSFDSAASILRHFPEHVNKSKKEMQTTTPEFEKNVYFIRSCNLSCNNNCSINEHPVGCDEKLDKHVENSFITEFSCHHSFISSISPNYESLLNETIDNKECYENTNLVPLNSGTHEEIDDGSFSMVSKNKSDNNVNIPYDEVFEDELDPSEYCVTMIDEQQNNILNNSKLCSTVTTEEHPSISIKKEKCKKKYVCRLCSKIFGWSTDLKRHILIHTGERPFKCISCNASFTRNFLLQKHLSKVHPCHISKEKLQFIEKGVDLNLKLLKDSLLNIPTDIETKG